MKRYIVFLKQVPRSTKVEIDPVNKTLKRSSALTQTNPDDLYALQAALNLRYLTGGEVVAVSMGPMSAETVLREAIQRGADRAILLSSPAFAGSDTWCTSLVLASAVRKIGGYDILFFGRIAIDGDTAQVGPEVAAQLDIPQITSLLNIEHITNDTLCVNRKVGDVLQHLEISLPCAVMVSRENGDLACPTLSGWRRAQQQEITCWNEADLLLDRTSVGLYASPTKVVSTSVPQSTKKNQWIIGAEEIAKIIQTYI